MTRVLAIVGPTAVGKSEVAVEVAERIGAEIVSVDSMQMYRGMDVGTDKATPDMRGRVSHHLLDVKEPSEELSVAEFQQQARAAIADIDHRDRFPLLVGGSGLYLRAALDDLEFPPRSDEVRAALEEQAAEVGPEALHDRLAAIDPAAATKIEPRNARRTIRALEVIELTGRPFSEADAWERYESIYDARIAGLERDRDDLFARIDARVGRMLEMGLVAEAHALAERGLGRTARQALGYRQVLDSPGASPEDLKAQIVRATKRFARRQLSWFRADPRVTWFDASAPGLADRLTAFLAD